MPAIDVLGSYARQTLLEVLACVAAADGAIDDEEWGAFRGACVALGAPERRLGGLDLGALELSRLSSREVMMIYCAAVWMALADGVQLRAESLVLERLRRRLRLDRATARMLAAHARWVRTSAELPWHRELDLLLVQAAHRLAQLEQRARADARMVAAH